MEKVIGAVSANGSYYNKLNKKLYVRGWFLAEQGYDEVRVNGRPTKMNLERTDVYNKFVEYDNRNAGFEYEEIILEPISKVKISVCRKGQEIYCKEYKIKIIDYRKFDKSNETILIGKHSSVIKFYYEFKNTVNIKSVIYDKALETILKEEQSIITDQLVNETKCKKINLVVGEEESELVNKLRIQGFHEFHDFWRADVLTNILKGRKMVVLHGNCHITRIKNVLQNCDEFVSKYFFYDIPLIYQNAWGGGRK